MLTPGARAPLADASRRRPPRVSGVSGVGHGVGRAGMVGGALVVALALTACGGSAAGTGELAPSSPVSSAASTPLAGAGSTDLTTAQSGAALVSRVLLRDADLAQGFTTRLIPGGDTVAGQVTLDNCGYRFTTESHRVARRQVMVVSSKGERVGVANEVVAYDSPTMAAKALQEFRTSVTHCPKNVYEKSAVAGVPPMRYEVSTVATVPTLPVQDNAVATVVVGLKGTNERMYGLIVFQRNGAVLDGIYLQMTTKPAASDLTTVESLAGVLGQRLSTA